ncbi:MAG: hypothetical protein RBT63_00915 [Bdellovibrionales bacterium]|jgi:hypothetical protein|nr:hypothetical protein [Bdellovibrionales bacterium]
MTEKRRLTPFLANEMLFDYVTGQLDSERRELMDDFLDEDSSGKEDNVETRALLESVRQGIKYAESLKSIELTSEALREIEQAENFASLSKRVARWSEWPDSLRWSIVALLVSVSTAAMVVAIPWKAIPIFKSGPSFLSGSIEIARVQPRSSGDDPNLGNVTLGNEDDRDGVEIASNEGSGDEEFGGEETPVAAIPGPKVAGSRSEAPVVPLPTATPIEMPVATLPVESPSQAASSQTASKSSRGFVYRAFMTLSDLENIAPKITQQMKELGAEKAGEVELGWRRGSGRYYHFSLPEANEPKLLDSLRAYGPVRISKDPHPRVMPEGQVRFILWIESGI